MADETPIRRPPRQRLLTLSSNEGERHASWLELFFDLVFVLAVAKVAAILARESDLYGFLKFVALFVPVWWAWVGYTFYADRFESDKIEFRVMMFAAMLAVAVWALTLGGAFTLAGDPAFVGSYVAVLGILILLYIATAIHVPLARPLAARFIFAFGTTVALMLVSLLFEPPVRYWLWLAALLIALVSPFLNLRQTRTIPFDLTHIPERFGLFTIIVLGEAVVATANGVAGAPWNFTTGIVAVLGFAMAACIWWINFEFVEDDAIKSPKIGPRFVYLYGHFFTVASIVAIGIGVEHSIKEAAQNHLRPSTLVLLGGGVAVYLAAITIVKLASGVCRLLFVRLTAIAASVGIAALGAFLPPFTVVIGLLAVLVIGAWLESRFAEQRETSGSTGIARCEHAAAAVVFEPRSTQGCEQCVKNNYKWVHLRVCLTCGHVGCCDSSVYKHASKHFHAENHPLMASLEELESWAWCYVDERFVPLEQGVGNVVA
ncbi:MAG: low temperature requirement protein A [Blastocatellia bacterium]|nr:low temperature requirement protein A [Blastocatellia bacterium]